jgi:hypothetical protein
VQGHDEARQRILFTFAGGSGHFLPLVPFARAAGIAGHAVSFAAQSAMLATVAEAGFTAFDTGGASLLPTGKRTPLLELDAEREARAVREGFGSRIARERAAAVLALCERWQPDILGTPRSSATRSPLRLAPSTASDCSSDWRRRGGQCRPGDRSSWSRIVFGADDRI